MARNKLRKTNIFVLSVILVIVSIFFIWALSTTRNDDLFWAFSITFPVFIILASYLFFVVNSRKHYRGLIKDSAIMNILALIQFGVFWIWGRYDTLKCIAANGSKCGLGEMMLLMLSSAIAGIFLILGILFFLIGSLKKKR